MNDPVTGDRTRRFGLPPRPALAIGAAAVLAVGAVAGTVAGHAMRPAIEMAPLTPVAIHSLAAGSNVITVRGRVAEIFGNKLVIDDGSGRALVDTGPEGEDHALAAVGAPVTVQGRFERGFVRASFLVDAGGKVTALGPLGGPPHDRHGPPPRPGEGPPPPVTGNAPPPGAMAPPPPPPAAAATQ